MVFVRKRGLRHFVLCAIVLMIFAQTFRKILSDFTESKTQNFQNDGEYVPKITVWALLCFFSWVVTKKRCSENLWGVSTWSNPCFLFKCRVTFWLRQFSKATFGTLALYILRLRCLAISNTYINSFCFLSKTETFRNDVEYVPKMTFWALLGLILLLWVKNLFWEKSEISLHETIRVFGLNAESRFGCSSYRRLRLVLSLFTSCVWDVLGFRILIQTAFVSWAKQKPPKKTLITFQKVLFELCSAWFFGCKQKKLYWELAEISLHETIPVFCSNAESRFGCANFVRTLRLVIWLFTSCVWDVLRYRILTKTAFEFFGNVVSVVLYFVPLFWWFSHKPSEKYWAISPKAKHKISKKTLSTFQKCLFERCSAFFFGFI